MEEKLTESQNKERILKLASGLDNDLELQDVEKLVDGERMDRNPELVAEALLGSKVDRCR